LNRFSLNLARFISLLADPTGKNDGRSKGGMAAGAGRGSVRVLFIFFIPSSHLTSGLLRDVQICVQIQIICSGFQLIS